MISKIHSCGLFSTWMFHQPSHSLFDCGDGCASKLDNHIFSVKRIFLTHGHVDHISGLFGFLGLYGSRRSDVNLEIYYPQNNHSIENMIKFIQSAYVGNSDRSSETELRRRLKCDFTFIPLLPGDKVSLSKKHYIEAFKVEHARGHPCYGYRYGYVSRRLKSEFVGLDVDVLNTMTPEKKLEVTYEQFVNEMTFGGDSMPIPNQLITGAKLLFHDTSFLDYRDRDDDKGQHASLFEALEQAELAKVVHFVGIHLSKRYSGNDIDKALALARAKYPNMKIDILKPWVSCHEIG